MKNVNSFKLIKKLYLRFKSQFLKNIMIYWKLFLTSNKFIVTCTPPCWRVDFTHSNFIKATLSILVPLAEQGHSLNTLGRGKRNCNFGDVGLEKARNSFQCTVFWKNWSFIVDWSHFLTTSAQMRWFHTLSILSTVARVCVRMHILRYATTT